MSRREKLNAMGATLVKEAGKGSVWRVKGCSKLWRELYAQRADLAIKQQVQLTRFTKTYCENGREYLTPEQFKREGRFPDGRGTKIDVYVFKPFKWRLYGIIFDLDGKPAFVGLEIDPEKKQDKADQALLKRVAKDGGTLLAALEEKGNGKESEQKSRGNRSRGKPRR